MKTPTILILAMCFSVNAFANITLSKNRLYFGAQDRADALQLRNSGGQAMQFTTQMHLVKMTEQGTIVKIDDHDNSAIPMLKFSPRRGVVPAGGKQVIRFSVRRPKDLADGEYRAVFSVSTSVASEKPEAVTLKSTLAYNMPVIIRHGNTSANTEIMNSRLVYTENTPHIELWQTLEGNRSLFGNYTISRANGDVVGVLNGVAVYTPLDKRKVLIPLSQTIKNEPLTIQYQEVVAYGGKLEAGTTLNL